MNVGTCSAPSVGGVESTPATWSCALTVPTTFCFFLQPDDPIGKKIGIALRRCDERSLEALEFATLAWVDGLNMRRLLEPIDYLPPAEYEAGYHEQAAVA